MEREREEDKTKKVGHTQGVFDRSHHQQHESETPEIERVGEEQSRLSPGV